MSTPDDVKLLRRSEVASLLSMSARQVDRLTKSGALAVVLLDRMPRYRRADVKDLIQRRRSGPPV